MLSIVDTNIGIEQNGSEEDQAENKFPVWRPGGGLRGGVNLPPWCTQERKKEKKEDRRGKIEERGGALHALTRWVGVF